MTQVLAPYVQHAQLAIQEAVVSTRNFSLSVQWNVTGPAAPPDRTGAVSAAGADLGW